MSSVLSVADGLTFFVAEAVDQGQDFGYGDVEVCRNGLAGLDGGEDGSGQLRPADDGHAVRTGDLADSLG